MALKPSLGSELFYYSILSVFLSLLMWGYYGVNNLSGACIVVLQLVLLLILKHENIVRSLSQ